tara:strand:+ start:13396 stop:14148 length:753 start_codon:yes stop_codon:yes gene_type:complete
MASRERQNTVATLEKGLIALKAADGDHFDAVQFCYLEAMAKKAGELTGPVADIVANKGLAALKTYQFTLDCERQNMEKLIGEVGARHPEAAPELQALFDTNKLSAVKRLAARLDRRATSTPLATLLKSLEPLSQQGEGSPSEGPASAQLQEQENAVLELIAADSCHAAAPPAGELKSARYFRELRQQRTAQDRVARALKEAPEESGPLNPQKLIIRSMLSMRDISPGYLARFVSYVDTLFWLESAGTQNK